MISSGFKAGRMGSKRHHVIGERDAWFDKFKEKIWWFKAA